MALKATSLIVQMSPLSPTFAGTPQDLATEMIRRIKVLSPGGTNFIFIGDTAPSSNVGPWLKNGTKWYVWSPAISQYVPVDVTDSVTKSFFMGFSTPIGTTPPLWLQTTQDPSAANGNSFGQPIGWFFWNGTTWLGMGNVVLAGPTSARPPTPVNFQQFYDTTISVLIWWERNAWRTVAGSPNDVKAVTSLTLASALTQNPGWAPLGDSVAAWRGRAIVGATQDPGANPASVFSPNPGVPVQSAGATSGENTGLQTQAGSTTTLTPVLALWLLYKQ